MNSIKVVLEMVYTVSKAAFFYYETKVIKEIKIY